MKQILLARASRWCDWLALYLMRRKINNDAACDHMWWALNRKWEDLIKDVELKSRPYLLEQPDLRPIDRLRLAIKMPTDQMPMALATVRLPGGSILRLFSWIYSRKTVTAVFIPTILDVQHERSEAFVVGRLWNARWVTLRGYCSIGGAMLAQLPASLTRLIAKLWKAAS